METLQTRSTSPDTVECSPIVLRRTDQVRLVFMPTLLHNPADPVACVNGAFVYQRKGRKDEWTPLNVVSLATVKKGESYKLELHSSELLELLRGVRVLYQLKREQGLPRGSQTFVKVEAGFARFLTLGESDLKAFLDGHPQDAVTALLKIVRWVASSSASPGVAERLASLSPTDLPAVISLLGLAAMKAALSEWEKNRTNASEEYWQSLLSRHAAVLSQIFAYPILVIAQKAYVGGKRFNNKGGKEVDYLAKVAATDGLLLIEIKTPTTPLLGSDYRGVYPLSTHLNGAIAQVAHYRQSLMKNFAALFEGSTEALAVGEPRCVVIAGDANSELSDTHRKNSFELLRDRVQGVMVITFDELFARVQQGINAFEEPIDC